MSAAQPPHLAGGIMPIQGPPGAGKTFTGARMICELVRRGKKVGITANSHKVIRNLIDATIKAADELGIALQCCQKADEVEDPQDRLFFAKKNEDLFAALSGGAASVGGGTAWLWSRPDAFETVDILFVDEAAQMSLANVLGVSQAAKAVVLIVRTRACSSKRRGGFIRRSAPIPPSSFMTASCARRAGWNSRSSKDQ
jgi:tRNA(Met) C34 N-acetyltransferase TmcA